MDRSHKMGVGVNLRRWAKFCHFALEIDRGVGSEEWQRDGGYRLGEQPDAS